MSLGIQIAVPVYSGLKRPIKRVIVTLETRLLTWKHVLTWKYHY